MNFEPNQIIYDDENYPSAAEWCNESNGAYTIKEIEEDIDGKRRFQIVETPKPTQEELDAIEEQKQKAIAEQQRVPDLEDATLDLAEYIAELENRIAELENK